MEDKAARPVESQSTKSLRWHDGVALAVPIASGVFITAGYTTASIGTWGTVGVCLGLAIMALLQNYLFAEMAAMFPEKGGGISVFAYEAWKRYFSPFGAISAFGYWCGWGLVLSIVGLTLGSLIQAQWFASSTWTFSTGLVNIGLAHIIAGAAVVGCTLINLIGIKVAAGFNKIISAIFLVFLAGLIIVPLSSGNWTIANLSFHPTGPWDGWKVVIVWFYVGAWTVYGSELCASFAPEYKDTVRDTSRAMLVMALLLIAVYTLVPMVTTGYLGEDVASANPINYGVMAYQKMLGPFASSLATAILCAVLFVGMVASAADAARALCGISQEGMNVRQLGKLSKRGEPILALVLTMIVNLLVLAFVKTPVAILVAGNLGYLVAVTFAVSGFVLLRRDRPTWPRPIKLGRAWVPIACLLTVFNAVVLVIGVTSPELAAGAGFKEVAIGFILLFLGVLGYVYRQIVQDRGTLRLREPDDLFPATES